MKGPRLRTHVFVAAVCAVLLAASPAVAEDAAAPSVTVAGPASGKPVAVRIAEFPEPGTTYQLSNEATFSRWANPAAPSPIYAQPSRTGRAVGKIRFFTEDGFPEVYMLLRQYTDERGTDWVELRIPKRPNGQIGWVPRESLGPYHVTRDQLIINRKALTITLLRKGRKIFSTRVGIGKAATPTPPGRFVIREHFSFKPLPLYGRFALVTSNYSNLSDWPRGGVVGIHGTDNENNVPGRPSHGCVRLRKAPLERLFRLTSVGIPLWVR